jgi:hypothetical protein
MCEEQEILTRGSHSTQHRVGFDLPGSSQHYLNSLEQAKNLRQVYCNNCVCKEIAQKYSCMQLIKYSVQMYVCEDVVY